MSPLLIGSDEDVVHSWLVAAALRGLEQEAKPGGPLGADTAPLPQVPASLALAARVGCAHGSAPVQPANTEQVTVSDVPGAQEMTTDPRCLSTLGPATSRVWSHGHLCGDPHNTMGGVASR